MASKSIVVGQIRQKAFEVLPADSNLFLYGSRARGDSKKDSDWDLLIIVNKTQLEPKDYDELVYPFTSLGWDLKEMIIPVIYTTNEWAQMTMTPFYKNIQNEAILLK